MTDYVARFCLDNHIRLSSKTADNFRQLPFSIYHVVLKLGVCRQGITDGLVAYVKSPIDGEIFEVHWSNCRKADTGENAQFKTGKSLSKVKEAKPKKKTKKQLFDEKMEELLKTL